MLIDIWGNPLTSDDVSLFRRMLSDSLRQHLVEMKSDIWQKGEDPILKDAPEVDYLASKIEEIYVSAINQLGQWLNDFDKSALSVDVFAFANSVFGHIAWRQWQIISEIRARIREESWEPEKEKQFLSLLDNLSKKCDALTEGRNISRNTRDGLLYTINSLGMFYETPINWKAVLSGFGEYNAQNSLSDLYLIQKQADNMHELAANNDDLIRQVKHSPTIPELKEIRGKVDDTEAWRFAQSSLPAVSRAKSLELMDKLRNDQEITADDLYDSLTLFNTWGRPDKIPDADKNSKPDGEKDAGALRGVSVWLGRKTEGQPSTKDQPSTLNGVDSPFLAASLFSVLKMIATRINDACKLPLLMKKWYLIQTANLARLILIPMQPFSDGNKRAVTALVNTILHVSKLPPIISFVDFPYLEIGNECVAKTDVGDSLLEFLSRVQDSSDWLKQLKALSSEKLAQLRAGFMFQVTDSTQQCLLQTKEDMKELNWGSDPHEKALERVLDRCCTLAEDILTKQKNNPNCNLSFEKAQYTAAVREMREAALKYRICLLEILYSNSENFEGSSAEKLNLLRSILTNEDLITLENSEEVELSEDSRGVKSSGDSERGSGCEFRVREGHLSRGGERCAKRDINSIVKKPLAYNRLVGRKSGVKQGGSKRHDRTKAIGLSAGSVSKPRRLPRKKPTVESSAGKFSEKELSTAHLFNKKQIVPYDQKCRTRVKKPLDHQRSAFNREVHRKPQTTGL